jgi:ribosomal protein L13E
MQEADRAERYQPRMGLADNSNPGTMMNSKPKDPTALRKEPPAEDLFGREESGFSILELDRAGISESRAHALGLPIDGTRHDALSRNIHHLKSFAS